MKPEGVSEGDYQESIRKATMALEAFPESGPIHFTDGEGHSWSLDASDLPVVRESRPVSPPEYRLTVDYRMRGSRRRHEESFDTEANALAAAKFWCDDETYGHLAGTRHVVIDWWINKVELVAEKGGS